MRTVFLGADRIAVEAGSVTAIALSADHTYVACGHEDGSIFSWELRNPSLCARHIPATKPPEIATISGHLYGVRITHIGFVGARHSCFVTSDSRGMTFHHNFTRRLLGSNVQTTRILGRYPSPSGGVLMKPSTTYSSSILPLGTMPHFTDSLGLVAILTPYKLVIVSTSPVPRTQYKYNRPIGTIAESDVISGCAAWFPCVRPARSQGDPASAGTKPTLAFSWCKRLQFLTVENAQLDDSNDPVANSIARTNVKLLREYQCPESIVAMQWHSFDIISLLTKSCKMLLLETSNLRTVGQCDLLSKHILHHNIHASLLKDYFQQREAEFVVQDFADDYTCSFQTYKGKTFLLGANDISVGSLLTWADKASAYVSNTQYIEAIQLLTGYYQGTVELGGLDLPTHSDDRKTKLKSKMYETMQSSVIISLSSEDLSVRSDAYHSRLLAACFEACMAMEDLNFLFDVLFEIYNDADRLESFLNLLAANVLDDSITSVPPRIVQEIVSHFTAQGLHTRLEDIVCHLEPDTLDVNHIFQLCKRYHLINAMAYIMTETLQDFVAPMVEFVALMKAVLQATANDSISKDMRERHLLGINTVNAVKVFSYVSLTLRGLSFPLARVRTEAAAECGKSALYDFIFSGSNVSWPPGSGCWITTQDGAPEPTFPYLRLLLLFDTPTFLASMDEAFEDSFLNDNTSSFPDTGQYVRKTITRQFIVNILLDVTNDNLPLEDAIYLYMFIARNVPKYPQFILLSGTVLQNIIIGLCRYQDPEIAEDCQLSVEYILSMFHPSDSSLMLDHYKEAGFFRVLKSIYRSEHRWAELILANLRATGPDNQVFSCIEEVLGSKDILTPQERERSQEVLLQHIVEIASIDGVRAAEVVDRCAPVLHKRIFNALLTREGLLYIYLQGLMKHENIKTAEWIDDEVRQKYVDLLCIYERAGVLEYIKRLKLSDVNVAQLLDNLEKYDLVDSIVYLMSVQGEREAALARVVGRLTALHSSITTTYHISQDEFAAEIETIGKYAHLGAGLCQAESSSSFKASDMRGRVPWTSQAFTRPERMWTDLILVLVGYLSHQKAIDNEAIWHGSDPIKIGAQSRKHGKQLRKIVQNVFSRLLISATSTRFTSFVKVFRSVLEHFSAKSVSSHIREIIRELFDGHQFHFQMLNLAETILASELFFRVERRNNAFRKGWTAKRPSCIVCQDRLYDDHLVRALYKARQGDLAISKAEREDRRRAAIEKRHGVTGHRATGKQRKQCHGEPSNEHTPSEMNTTGDFAERRSTIISFACGHSVHELCYTSRKAEIYDGSIQCPGCTRAETIEPESGDQQSPTETFSD